MNRDKQIKKVNNLYNSMCCLIIYADKEKLNYTTNRLKEEIEKLKL